MTLDSAVAETAVRRPGVAMLRSPSPHTDSTQVREDEDDAQVWYPMRAAGSV